MGALHGQMACENPFRRDAKTSSMSHDMPVEDRSLSTHNASGAGMTATGSPILVMIDGRDGTHALADASAPQLRVDDPIVSHGDGVFETMLATHGVLRKPEAHLRRLAASAAAAGLDAPDAQVWRDAVATAMRAHRPCADMMVKLVLGRGPHGTAACTAWVYAANCSGRFDAVRRDGVDALLLERGCDAALGPRAPWLLLGAKSLSYALNMAALRHARSQGADDAIFVSADGFILEGATSNVIIARRDGDDAVLLTPPHDASLLPGTTQAALFEAAAQRGWRTTYAALTPDDLFTADGVWLSSSLRLLAPVNRLDGRALMRSPALDAALFALLDTTLG